MSEAPIVLQKFFPVWGLPDFSPFCFKAEVYLKLASIPYTTELGDSRKTPKQKLPVIRDGARTIADSSAIIEHLERTRSTPLDVHLTAQQRAIATAVRSMLEEHLYFVIVYQRWKEDHNWAIYKSVFIELIGKLGVPGFVRGLVLGQVRKQMVGSLKAQGVGRHSPEEIRATGKRILESVSELCVGPFFFGEQPSSLDATVYAFVASIAGGPFEGPLEDYARNDPKLSRYCAHMKARCAL
jgi:glutathione S-transferase